MFELEFTNDEICIVINVLDFYSRIWIGQYDHILWELRWSKNCSQLDASDKTLCRKLENMRNIILPGLYRYGLNGSYGIFSPERDVKAAVAYDMQQEFRYRRAWFLNPEGGNTVDFGRPLPCEDDPCDFPKAECYNADGEFRIEIHIDETQLGVIIDALNIKMYAYDCKIRELFEYYTDAPDALDIAEELTDLLTSIDTEYPVKKEPYCDLIQKLSEVRTK